MSSLRSHFRHHLQPNSADQDKKQSSRIPTKLSNVESKPSKAAQHVSKLTKRASRTITSELAPEQSTARAPTIASNPATQGRRLSVAPGNPVPSARHHASPAPPTIRTPSLISGSSASTFDSPRSNGLRRKPSGAIDRYAAQRRAELAEADLERATMHSRSAFDDDTVLGISFPHVPGYGDQRMHVNYDQEPHGKQPYSLDKRTAFNVTPPIPPPSITPSTRYTESPFSHAQTPSSTSSYSPAVALPTKSPARQRQPSPTRTRPPVSGKAKAKEDPSQPGLAPVRESSTSSTSTVRNQSTRLPLSKKELPRKPSSGVAPPSRPSEVGKSAPQSKPARNSRSSIIATQPGQVLPEFAHLDVERDPNSQAPRPPPVRPSRDGTPDLVGMENSSRVVQSDLPRLYTTYHKRTPSTDTPVSAPSPSFKSRFGFSPKLSQRGESPRVDSAFSPSPPAHRFSRGPTPDLQPSDGPSLRRRDSPAVASSPSKSSRFGFFSRKTKIDVEKPTEKPKRAPTKGPAAGTGHERYGRYGFRGRSGSTTSSGGFRSSSADSTSSSVPHPRLSTQSSLASKDGSELDDFLRERLKPVILRGSGGTLSRTTSESEVPIVAPHPVLSSRDDDSRPQLLPSALQEANGFSPQKRTKPHQRRPSDSSEDDVGARYLHLAARRSFTRLSQQKSGSPTRAPPPINTNLSMQPTAVDSYDAETSAWPQTDSSLALSGHAVRESEKLWLRSPQAQVLKPAKKLNFFQRALAAPRAKGKERAIDVGDHDRLAVHQPPHRTAVHYAMLDPVDSVGLDEVGRIVRENETSAEESMSEPNPPPKIVPYEKRHTSLLPSPAKLDFGDHSRSRTKPTPPTVTVSRQEPSGSPELLRAKRILPRQSASLVNIPRSPSLSHGPSPNVNQGQNLNVSQEWNEHEPAQAHFGTPDLNQNHSPKQPRLSPVGRIPKVISNRDRDRKLPETSFSRPFVRTQIRPAVKPPGSIYNQIREMASPIEGGSQPVSSTGTRSNRNSADPNSGTITNATSVSTNRTSMDIHAQNEFFEFPRKDSDPSYSTSSGNPSFMSAMYAPPLQQDDIWNEYNDFLDDVDIKSPGSERSLGAPFQHATPSEAQYGPMRDYLDSIGPAPTADLPLPPGSVPVQTVLSVPQQISRFLQPAPSPMTPDTLSGFIGGYGNRSTSTLFTSHRASLPPPERSAIPRPMRSSLSSVRESVASHSTQFSSHSRSNSLLDAGARNSRSNLTPSVRSRLNSQLSGIAATNAKDPTSKANLRRGALMTSKWLSFGRVLFSPAHNDIHFVHEPRILILDGLSSDWSYYVAASYPSAEVYNLGQGSTDAQTAPWSDPDRKIPTNHRQIPLSAISASFPFPKGFFTAVVFRFPNATTEDAYHACISECKRVLRPGGYLEVAVLDLDLANMSTKTRKAVRDLKTSMQLCDRDVCLSNLSDVLVRLIGRRGFDDVQRCIVGVPAAGRIPRSRDGSSASSSDNSGKPAWHQPIKEFNFTDMFEDAQHSQIGPGKRNDESITKMVAKVGRWWYSACYERALLPDDHSIWNGRTLLRECEKQGTSFRLLICHAQKPAQTRRRTVSV